MNYFTFSSHLFSDCDLLLIFLHICFISYRSLLLIILVCFYAWCGDHYQNRLLSECTPSMSVATVHHDMNIVRWEGCAHFHQLKTSSFGSKFSENMNTAHECTHVNTFMHNTVMWTWHCSISSSKCPEKIFERRSESPENYSSRPTKKLNMKKWGIQVKYCVHSSYSLYQERKKERKKERKTDRKKTMNNLTMCHKSEQTGCKT